MSPLSEKLALRERTDRSITFNPVISRLALAALFSALSYVAMKYLGVQGQILLPVALLGASVAIFFAWRAPVVLFTAWLTLLAGGEGVGMIPMPGLPDITVARLLLMFLMALIVLGMFWGKTPFKAPLLPDILVVLHTSYLLYNIMFIADGDHFHLWYIYSFIPAIAYFFAKQYFFAEHHIRNVLLSFVFLLIYFWWVSIAEHFRLTALVYPKAIMVNEGERWMGRSRGPFMQPALFGQIMGTYMLANLYFLTRDISQKYKLLLWANFGLSVVGILFTYTRGGWVATVAGMIVLGVLRPKFRKILAIMAITGVLIGGLGLINLADDEMLAERFTNEGTIEGRVGVFLATLKAVQQNPVFGVGFFMFRDDVAKYAQGAYVPLFGYVKDIGNEGSIHEMYVGRAAEEGLLGMGLYFGFVAAIAWQLVRRWRENPQGEWYNRDLLALLAAMTIVYLVGGLAIDFRYFCLVNVLPYFCAGLVAGYPSGTKAAARTPRTGARGAAG